MKFYIFIKREKAVRQVELPARYDGSDDWWLLMDTVSKHPGTIEVRSLGGSTIWKATQIA